MKNILIFVVCMFMIGFVKAENPSEKNIKVCNQYVMDIKDNNNFKPHSLVMANEISPDQYVCIVRGFVTTSHSGKLIQLVITANDKTGNYEYH